MFFYTNFIYAESISVYEPHPDKGYIIENNADNKIFHIYDIDYDNYDSGTFEIIPKEFKVNDYIVKQDVSNVVDEFDIYNKINENNNYTNVHLGYLNDEDEKILLVMMPHFDAIAYTSAYLIRFSYDELKILEGILRKLYLNAIRKDFKFDCYKGTSVDKIYANLIETTYLLNHYDEQMHNKYLKYKKINRSALENKLNNCIFDNEFWYTDNSERKKYSKLFNEIRVFKYGYRRYKVYNISDLVDDMYYNIIISPEYSPNNLIINEEVNSKLELGNQIYAHCNLRYYKGVDDMHIKCDSKIFTYIGDEERSSGVHVEYEPLKTVEEYLAKKEKLVYKKFISYDDEGNKEYWYLKDNETSQLVRMSAAGYGYSIDTDEPFYSIKVLKNARCYVDLNGYEYGNYWFNGKITIENFNNMANRKFSYYIYDHLNNFDNNKLNDGKEYPSVDSEYANFICGFNVNSEISVIEFDDKGFVVGIYS